MPHKSIGVDGVKRGFITMYFIGFFKTVKPFRYDCYAETHIHWLHFATWYFFAHRKYIPGLGLWIATYAIHYFGASSFIRGFYSFFPLLPPRGSMITTSGLPCFSMKSSVEYVFDISGIKLLHSQSH